MGDNTSRVTEYLKWTRVLAKIDSSIEARVTVCSPTMYGCTVLFSGHHSVLCTGIQILILLITNATNCDSVLVSTISVHSQRHRSLWNEPIHLLYIHYTIFWGGPRWPSGNTLASHLWGRSSIPGMASSVKAGSCLPLVGSLQYRTLTPTVCTGFLRPSNYPSWYDLYSVESDVKPQINK